MEKKTFSLKLGEKELVAEINDLPEQANGSIWLRKGDTVVQTTCVMSRQDIPDRGFFPLTVEYEEKYYAAGKIKGPRYIKRESRPSDEAICNARLIDRPIRPLFPEGILREVQIITTVLSWDSENDPDILGVNAASLALLISDIPWSGPVAAVRVVRVDNNFVLNPTYADRIKSDLDVVFTGILDNDEVLINMIEGGFEEIAEDVVSDALEFAKPYLKEIIIFQKEIAAKMGKEKIKIDFPLKDPELEKRISEFLNNRLENAFFKNDKTERYEDLESLKQELASHIEESYPGEGKIKYALSFFEKEIDRVLHENAIKHGKRADGRSLNELRKIECQAGILPRTHGSGLFCRGQTKALSILTLGAPGDQQILEGMEITGKKRFMHHYNFPPYSSGEIKPLRGPGRREIGHGMLAEKALLPLIPGFEDFPYTIRVVSEILSSNGSTSMASVSAAALALMDAGVPIKNIATGISIGLAQDQKSKDYQLLTDIQGPEDHYGDMDFKVAGTKDGITAIQMDVKIQGINSQMVKEAMGRAKQARLEILKTISKTLDKPRADLSPFAPRILKLQINPEKIREVIGPGGKVINEIIDQTGVAIDIEDSGLIFITSEKEETAQKALEWIKNIIREVKVGEVFKGKVERILAFGAFVKILPNQEGLIHISKLSNRRVARVEDVVNIGDIVSVKVISIDEHGRINLMLLEKE